MKYKKKEDDLARLDGRTKIILVGKIVAFIAGCIIFLIISYLIDLL